MTGLLARLFGRKRDRGPVCAAVVAAAGSSTRMGGQDKLLLPLGEQPVLARTLRALEACPRISEIVVVTRRENIVPIGQLCRDFGLEKVTKVLRGGASRLESVLLGVREVPTEVKWIAVHDGARPFVTPELVERVLDRAVECGAAAPAVPVKDTVKRARDGRVEETLERQTLFAVQTPQIFDADLIRGALQKAQDDHAPVTDDCSAVERMGAAVYLVQGDDCNLKITTPSDLLLAEGILNGRATS